MTIIACWVISNSVSYTHLDVYKRQAVHSVLGNMTALYLLVRLPVNVIWRKRSLSATVTVMSLTIAIGKMCIRDRYQTEDHAAAGCGQ